MDRYQVGSRTGTFQGQFEEYLSAYWRFFHPLCPIIHRPTFNPDASPPLRLAMAALGTQFFGRAGDREVGSELHKDCKRMIELSNAPDIQSMQAILLTEMFARFRSQKIDIQPFKAFKSLHDHLLGKLDLDAASVFSRIDSSGLQALLATTFTNEFDTDPQTPQQTRIWHHWAAFEVRQRLRSACFMFDTHQSLSCDQSPTRPDVNATRIAYIFPYPNEHWLAQGAKEWCYKVSSSSSTSSLSNGSNEQSSYYQHFLLCSFLSILPSRDLRNMTPNHPEADTSVITSTFPDSLVAHSYLQFCYLPDTHAPCITVPIPLLYVCIYVQHHAQLNEHKENL